MDDFIKIHFSVESDEDGYPEVGAETLWAKPTKDANGYIIDNIPFLLVLTKRNRLFKDKTITHRACPEN